MVHRDDRIQVKCFVAKNNTTFKLKHVKVLIQSWVINVAACANGNICKEGGRIRYSIPVCVSQSDITRTTCICLLQDQTLTEFTISTFITVNDPSLARSARDHCNIVIKTRSATKAAVLPGTNRCGSFLLLSVPHSLFSIWTDLKDLNRSQGPQHGSPPDFTEIHHRG